MFQLIKYNAFLLVPFDPSTKELILGEIFEVLRDIAYMWEKLGVFLGIPHNTIWEIRSVEMPMYEMEEYIFLLVLCEWISSKQEEATIDNLISAIRTSFGGGLPCHVEEQIMARHQRGNLWQCSDSIRYESKYLMSIIVVVQAW